MATIRSLVESVGVLKRNPVLFAVGALYAVILLPQTALSTFGIPILPNIVQLVTFFITPLVVAGLVGMAYEGRVRDTSFETFKKVGRDRYVSVLLGNLLQFGIWVGFAIVSFLVAIVFVFAVGFGSAAATDGGQGVGALLGGVGILGVAVFGLIFLAFLGVQFLIQFYAVSIVVDNVGVVDGFRNSVQVVVGNIVQALGFGVINLVIGTAIALPTILLFLLPLLQGQLGMQLGVGRALSGGSGTGMTLLSRLAVVVYSFLVSIVVTPFQQAFSVSFYDNHTES
jgi:hypothetical protein